MAYRYRTIKVNGKTKLFHRHVMEQHIGRALSREEQVHHRDNRLENLELMTLRDHQVHHKQRYPLTKTCAVCSAVFTPHPTKRLRAKTCSPTCGHRLHWQTRKASA